MSSSFSPLPTGADAPLTASTGDLIIRMLTAVMDRLQRLEAAPDHTQPVEIPTASTSRAASPANDTMTSTRIDRSISEGAKHLQDALYKIEKLPQLKDTDSADVFIHWRDRITSMAHIKNTPPAAILEVASMWCSGPIRDRIIEHNPSTFEDLVAFLQPYYHSCTDQFKFRKQLGDIQEQDPKKRF
jgi:hypothetical protein